MLKKKKKKWRCVKVMDLHVDVKESNQVHNKSKTADLTA